MNEIKNPKLKCMRKSSGHVKYKVENLDKGYGNTLGNSLKRILFSALPEYVHNPVTNVEISVEDNIDTENLILEIWTSSLVDPDEVLKSATNKLKGYLEIFA